LSAERWKDLVVGAAQLEGKNRLQIFALEQYPVPGTRRKAGREVQRCFAGDVVDLGVENSFEVVHGHDGGRCVRQGKRRILAAEVVAAHFAGLALPASPPPEERYRGINHALDTTCVDKALTQEAGVVAFGSHFVAQLLERREAVQGRGMGLEPLARVARMSSRSESDSRWFFGMDQHAVEAEAAGLEAVVVVDQIIVLDRWRFVALAGACGRAPAGRQASAAARSTVSGVSQTRSSIVPYSGFGRISQ
jgi:hypothetical protein